MENTDKRLLTTNQILDRYPVGRTRLYAVLEGGSLKSVKWGRKYLVREEDLEKFLEGHGGQPENF